MQFLRAVVLVLFLQAALGAAPTVAVRAGFRGLSSSGRVMPVSIILTGDGVDRQLIVLVEGTPAVRREVELPRGTTKRISVYTKPDKGFGAGPPVLIVRDEEAVYHQEPLTTQQVHYGSLLPVVGGPPLVAGDIRSPALSPDVLPDRALGYASLRALAVYPEAWAKLPAPVLEALVLWVRQGGMVVLPLQYRSVGLDLDADHPFGPLRAGAGRSVRGLWRGIEMELALDDPQLSTVERRRIQPWDTAVVADMPRPANPTFKAWVERAPPAPERLPLIGDLEFGLGRLRFLAFDPSDWDRAEVRGPRSDVLQRLAQPSSDATVPTAIQTHILQGQEGNFRVIWFFAFLVAYLILIGPVDFWLVRRLGRPRLTWVTFPVVVLVFCSIAWGMGQGRIGALTYHEVSVVEFLGKRALGGVGYGFVGVYSDTNEALNFRPRVARGEVSLLGKNLDLFGGRWAYDQRRSTADLVQKMNIWSTHGYRVLWRERDAYLGARLVFEDGERRVEIEQALPLAPSGGWVRIAGQWRSLSDWQPTAGEANYTASVGEHWPSTRIQEFAASLDAPGLGKILFEMPATETRSFPRLVLVLPEPWNVIEVVNRGTADPRGFCVVRCPLVVTNE